MPKKPKKVVFSQAQVKRIVQSSPIWVKVEAGKTLSTLTGGVEVLINKNPDLGYLPRDITQLRPVVGKIVLQTEAWVRCLTPNAILYVGDNSTDVVNSYVSKQSGGGGGGGGITNPLTEDLDGGGFGIVNIKDPVANQDVATKGYVDAQSGGGGGGEVLAVHVIVSTSAATYELDESMQKVNIQNVVHSNTAYFTPTTSTLLTVNKDMRLSIVVKTNTIFTTSAPSGVYTTQCLWIKLNGSNCYSKGQVMSVTNLSTADYNLPYLEVSQGDTLEFAFGVLEGEMIGQTLSSNSSSQPAYLIVIKELI